MMRPLFKRPTVEDEQGDHLGDAELPIFNKWLMYDDTW